ncbi:unnamed protein product, partial [Ectocarpus sp. 4 AP-2014]
MRSRGSGTHNTKRFIQRVHYRINNNGQNFSHNRHYINKAA